MSLRTVVKLCMLAAALAPFTAAGAGAAPPNDAFGDATALSGACPWLSLDGNLLPADRRRASSRFHLIVTASLGVLLAVLVVMLALQTRWSDGRILGVLQHEIQRQNNGKYSQPIIPDL